MLHLSDNRVPTDDVSVYQRYLSETLSTPRNVMTLKRWIAILFIVLGLTLFLPWQQNINGKGTVSALTPQDRPQTVQNAIDGQIAEWYVREGQRVEKGDTLLVLREIKDDYFDPQLVDRLREQIDAKQSGIESYDTKKEALQNQIDALRANYQLSLQKARNKIIQSRNKVASDSIEVVNERLQVKTAKERYDRGKVQVEQQLIPLMELETRQLKLQETQTKLAATQNKLQISRQELLNSQLELTSVTADYNEKIAKATSDLSSAQAAYFEGQTERSKLENKKASVLVRQGLYVLRAPQAGYVVRTLRAGIGETIKQGDAVCILQPTDPNVAVELYIRAMDVPLISKDREVRLQFEGWPALQFSGWPSVAVGTFGGRVEVIDFVQSPSGDYRILVTPKKGEQWPEQLRVGSGVLGWVMLENVPLWYELWRQLNAFPPSLKEKPSDETLKTGDSSKKEK